jgi:SAM-dependent methyltransferase
MSDGQTILAINDRYQNYLRAEIAKQVDPHDGMYNAVNDVPVYLAVGKSAIDVVMHAMILAGKPVARSVLDLPCGGGRITRHLTAFFPDSEIFACDSDRRLENFVVETFGVKRFHTAADFSQPSERQFDLVFVGSLVTHLDQPKFKRAVSWFISALAPDGLLVLTTHGRQHDLYQRYVREFVPAGAWNAARKKFLTKGFGYVPYSGPEYGLSICKPSWLLAVVENDPSIRILALQEGAWNQHQDILVVQKKALRPF